MNPEHLTSLKQAADLIKLGKTKPARGLIIDVLREDPENVQAWYMLSFAVPKVDKQIYALEQTLKLAPDHQKALDRLKKLGGDVTHSDIGETTDKTDATIEPKQEVSGEDLLSQRLFGEATPAKESTKIEEEAVSKPPVFYHEIAEQSELDKEKTSPEDSEPETEEKTNEKVFGIPRRIFFIGVGILIVAIGTLMAYSSQLLDLVKNSSPALQSGISTMESLPEPTETPSPSATPTDIPPTATPRPTNTPVTLNLFSTSDLIPPSEGQQILLDSIQTGVESILNLTANSTPTTFLITDSRLQTFLWDFAKFEGFEDQVKQNQVIYQILGLAEPGDDFSSFYQNLWVDPNGTLYLPDKDITAIVGLDFSEYQKYSYAQAYVQFIRKQQYPDAITEFFPPCLEITQQCEIGLAIYKGEAAFSAREWALQAFDEETFTSIIETNKKLFYNPVLSPPSIMEAIRLFPYNYGLAFVEEIFLLEGWEGVQNLYEQLPTTTEQILHPEKYISGEVGAEVDSTPLSDLLSAEWQPVLDGSLGEWKTYLLLTAGTNLNAQVSAKEAQLAAAGWNGDHTQIFGSATGKSIITAHWKFDTETDAEEFFTIFETYTVQRFAGTPLDLLNISCQDNGSQVSCLALKESDVLWVTSPDSQLAELILRNYKFLQNE